MGLAGWSDWNSLGTPPGGLNLQPNALTVVANAIGCLHVFCIGVDGNLWHIQQSQPNGGPGTGWGTWSKIVNPAAQVLVAPIAVTQNWNPGGAIGRIEAFCLTNKGQLLHCWEATSATAANPSPAWSPLSPMPAQPPNVGGLGVVSAAANGNDGHLEVFIAGAEGSPGGPGVFHCWQTAPNNGWSDFELLFGNLLVAAVAAVVNSSPNGVNGPGITMEPFVLGNQPRVGNAPAGNLALFHLWQMNPGAGPWSVLSLLDSPFPQAAEGYVPGAPTVGRTSQGALEVFACDENGQLWRTIQGGGGSPDGWSPWSNNGQLAGCQQGFGVPAFLAVTRLSVYAGPGKQGGAAPVDYQYQLVFAVESAASAGVQFQVGQSYDEGGSPSDEQWSPNWQFNLGGGPASCLAAAANQDGRSEVFIIVNGALQHAWMLNPTLAPLGLP